MQFSLWCILYYNSKMLLEVFGLKLQMKCFDFNYWKKIKWRGLHSLSVSEQSSNSSHYFLLKIYLKYLATALAS
jgi:hypothetical protein